MNETKQTIQSPCGGNKDRKDRLLHLVTSYHQKEEESWRDVMAGLNMSRWSEAEAGNVMLPHSTCMQIASVCTRHNTTGASSKKQGFIERWDWIMSTETSHNMYTHNLTIISTVWRGKKQFIRLVYNHICCVVGLVLGLQQYRDHCPANGHQANSLF